MQWLTAVSLQHIIELSRVFYIFISACNVIFRRKVMARSLKNKDLKDWHNHPKMGRQIDEAAPFITFKVPIGRQNGTTYSWGIPNLLKTCREDLGSELGMVIDLCNTDKWYDPRELQRAGVRHVKIPIQGKKVHAFKA